MSADARREEALPTTQGADAERVSSVEASAYTVPTSLPEADGTLAWESTTLVLARARLADGTTGIGYTYGHPCLTGLVNDLLAGRVTGMDVRDSAALWQSMVRAVRNLGRPGLASMAIAAVDTALWDAKARLFGQPLHRVLGGCRDRVPIYGSGGFTTYGDAELVEQLGGWAEQGIGAVKLKVGCGRGHSWRADLARVRAVREALGPEIGLFVDANGAYDRTRAARMGHRFAEESDVVWFEEPVTSDDLDGLRDLAAALPMDVTAGEYGYQLEYFAAMLDARAVDVLQLDITRCAGVTEWLRSASAAEAWKVPTSAHCAPALHAQVGTVPEHFRHIEYFHDHVRIENMLFDGVPQPEGGHLRPAEAPGNGLAFKDADAEPYRVA